MSTRQSQRVPVAKKEWPSDQPRSIPVTNYGGRLNYGQQPPVMYLPNEQWNPYEQLIREGPSTQEVEPIGLGLRREAPPKKVRPSDYHEPEVSESSSDEEPPTRLQTFVARTKARKYRLASPEAKADQGYKLKRARNNDAVRKSRQKSKQLEEQKDQEHEEMKRTIIRLEKELEMEKEGRERDRMVIEELLSCRIPSQNGGAAPQRRGRRAPIKTEPPMDMPSTSSNGQHQQQFMNYFNGQGGRGVPMNTGGRAPNYT